METVASTIFFASMRTQQQTPHSHPDGALPVSKAALREPGTVLSGRNDTLAIMPEYLAVRWLYRTYYTPNPDISAQARCFQFFNRTFLRAVSVTSCATPVHPTPLAFRITLRRPFPRPLPLIKTVNGRLLHLN